MAQRCLKCRKGRKTKHGLCSACRPKEHDNKNNQGLFNFKGGEPELVESRITRENIDRLTDSITS